jgi:nucleoside-diphosphate-sugar epimerase
MKRKILLISGSGFIGSNICNELINKNLKFDLTFYKTKPISFSKKIKCIKLDLKNKKKILNIVKKYNIIVMCGGKIFNSRNEINLIDDFNENVEIHLNVLSAVCKQKIKKYMWFSSCTGYPESKIKINENDFFKDDPSYHKLPGWHSRFIEKVIESYSKIFNTKFISIRVPEVYGLYDNYNLQTCRNIPLIIGKSYLGKKINLESNKSFKKNYIYSKDLAKLSLQVLWKSKKNYQVFNICDDKVYSLLDFIKIVNKNLGLKSEIFKKSKIKSKFIYRKFDNEKIKKFLKIKKIGNINNSIKQTLNWYSLLN